MSSPPEPHVLAVDLGTSGPKVALISASGRITAATFEANEVLYLPGGGAEQRPEEWWRSIARGVRRALRESGLPGSAIEAVNCTGQWSGTVALGGDGEPLCDAIIWMDTRGARHVAELTGGILNIAGYSPGALLAWLPRTGGIPSRSGKDSLAHILFLKNERPEIFEATRCFLEPKDWLNFKLTGRMVSTYDAIALHWLSDNRSIDAVDYHPRLLARAGIERHKLPDLIGATDIVGPLSAEAAGELGVPAGIPVVAGAPDTHSAAVGSGAVRDNEVHLYVGTSSWMLAHVPRMRSDPLHNQAALPAALPGRYLLLNEQECAGACLSFLRDRLLLVDDELTPGANRDGAYAAFDRLAAGVPAGSGGVIFTPWLYGERTPVEDHHVRGGFFNLSLETDRAQMIRAVLEGVAYNTRWLFDGVESFLGRRVPHINFIGGGACSDLWCQIMADVLGCRVRRVADPIHANLRGAAFLAQIALGRLDAADIPARVEIEREFVFEPRNRHVYEQMFKAFKTLYKNNRRLYANLNAWGVE